MKKILQYLLICTIGVLFAKIIAQELFDNRPFKFEKYKSSEGLEEALSINFLIGIDLYQIVSALEKSGARCYALKPESRSENYAVELICDYRTGFISLYPLKHYSIWLGADHKHKLSELEAHIVSGWAYLL